MNPEAKPGPCWHKGETHIQRSRSLGLKVRIGKQRCHVCGAQIEVTEKRPGWAFYPPHDKP